MPFWIPQAEPPRQRQSNPAQHRETAVAMKLTHEEKFHRAVERKLSRGKAREALTEIHAHAYKVAPWIATWANKPGLADLIDEPPKPAIPVSVQMDLYGESISWPKTKVT